MELKYYVTMSINDEVKEKKLFDWIDLDYGLMLFCSQYCLALADQ